MAVTLHLLKAIAQIINCTHHPYHRVALEQQAEMILQGSREGLSIQRDQQMVEELYQQMMEARRA